MFLFVDSSYIFSELIVFFVINKHNIITISPWNYYSLVVSVFAVCQQLFFRCCRKIFSFLQFYRFSQFKPCTEAFNIISFDN